MSESKILWEGPLFDVQQNQEHAFDRVRLVLRGGSVVETEISFLEDLTGTRIWIGVGEDPFEAIHGPGRLEQPTALDRDTLVDLIATLALAIQGLKKVIPFGLGKREADGG